MITIPYYLIVGIAIYFLVYYSLVRKSDHIFFFSEVLEGPVQVNPSSNKNKSLIAKPVQHFLSVIQRNIQLKVDRRTELKLKLKQACIKQSPEYFVSLKIAYAVLMFFLFLILFALFPNVLLIGGGIIASAVMFYYPEFLLAKQLKSADTMKKIELADYLTPIAKLMSTETPYKAIKESQQFSGPFIKPFVEQLVIDIDLNPGSIKPFINFADQIGIPEAGLFAGAVQQAMHTDHHRAKTIFEKQRQIMMKLREESYHELINSKPLVVSKYNTLMLFNVGIFIMTIVLYMFYDLMSSM